MHHTVYLPEMFEPLQMYVHVHNVLLLLLLVPVKQLLQCYLSTHLLHSEHEEGSGETSLQPSST